MAWKKSVAEAALKNIRRNASKKYGGEGNIRIVIEGLPGDSARCRS